MVESERKHVAIVGGGLAGLAAATYLGRAGHRVTVFERSESLGGRAATTNRDGYLHNMGPHALYQGGAGVEVLAELGVAYTGNSPVLGGVAVRSGRAFTLPASARSMVATRLFGLGARLQASSHLFSLRNITASDHRTVREWLDSKVSDPGAREFLEALFRLATYSNAPETIPVGDAAAQLNGATNGVIYLEGGWQTLVRGLELVARAAGVVVRTGQRVEGIESSTNRVTGLRVAGEIVPADGVLLAVSPAVASSLAPGIESLATIAADAIPARAACLDIGLTRLPNPRRLFALGIDTPFYFSVHSAWANLAPDGKVLVSVAKYIPVDGPRNAEQDLAELEAFMDIVQPGWRAYEEHRQYLPNMVVTTALPRAENGGIAGRPAPEVDGVRGLFVAGDWVAGGGWLSDATLGSARAAAQAVSSLLAPTAMLPLATVS